MQAKSWFIPQLKSKYLTFEIFRYLFEYEHQVVAMLRALNSKSAYFMDRFWESEM